MDLKNTGCVQHSPLSRSWAYW